MNETIITIGHSAYSGTNAMRMCFSKAQAVRVLRARGVKRDAARAAVNMASASPIGYTSVRSGFDPIEIRNEQYNIEQGYMAPIPDLRKYWAKQPEA